MSIQLLEGNFLFQLLKHSIRHIRSVHAETQSGKIGGVDSGAGIDFENMVSRGEVRKSVLMHLLPHPFQDIMIFFIAVIIYRLP